MSDDTNGKLLWNKRIYVRSMVSLYLWNKPYELLKDMALNNNNVGGTADLDYIDVLVPIAFTSDGFHDFMSSPNYGFDWVEHIIIPPFGDYLAKKDISILMYNGRTLAGWEHNDECLKYPHLLLFRLCQWNNNNNSPFMTKDIFYYIANQKN